MNAEQRMVVRFHEACGLYAQTGPALPPPSVTDLRIALIEEELDELRDAMVRGDLVKIADGLGDLLYVVYGAGVAFGIDLEPVFAEIQRSNMTKVGGPIRADGKMLKPASYEPPELQPVLAEQGWSPE